MTYQLKLLEVNPLNRKSYIFFTPYLKYAVVITFEPITFNAFIQYFDKYN